jgi:uncharacterized protein YndB with AHSA1/START domain
MHDKITIEALVAAPLEKVWDDFTNKDTVVKWNTASEDWHCPRAENDLRVGGKFSYRMEAKDGSEGFDFTGTYDDVVPHERFAYTMDDGRQVAVTFAREENSVRVVVCFEPESENPRELQRAGWQAILDNFKRYAERTTEA